MTRNLVLLATLGSLAATYAAGQSIVQFKDHLIEGNERGGYAVIVADINHDGKPDIIGLSQAIPELAWYENPTWEKHVIATDLRGQVNLAPYDIDGDGIPELAVESGFAMRQDRSPGIVTLFAHRGDPRGPWKSYKIDQYPTAHHIAWADIDGSGHKVLIMAPLVGPTNHAPKYEGKTPLFYYHVPKDWSSPWKREMVDDDLNGITHRIRVVQWTTKGKKEQLFVAGFDGLLLETANGKGDHIKWSRKLIVKGHDTEEAPRLGLSDVKIGHLGKSRIIASVEPWHGNEVVVYTGSDKAGWARHVLYNQLTEGHEVCVGDFNGDGRDEIVAGDRARGHVASSHIFYSEDATGTKWHHEELDHMGMSASGCQVADINGDGRPDIIMIGGATHNIKWYENLGPAKPGTSAQ